MRWLLLVVLLRCAAASRVAELDEGGVEAMLASSQFAVIAFYAPWCDHCRQLWPELNKVLSDDIAFGRVDATQHTALATRFAIDSYPTLKLFEHAALVAEYDGPNSAESLKFWLESATRPLVVNFDNWTVARDVIQKAEALVVGVDLDVSRIARLSEDRRVIFATSPLDFVKELFTEQDITPPGIAVLNAFGERAWVEHDSEVASRLVPSVTVYDSSKTFWNVNLSVHALWFSPDALDEFSAAAERHRHLVRHVVVPERETRVRERFDATEGLVLVSGHRHFKMPPTVTIDTFYDNFFKGLLRPSLRSEVAYASDDKSPVMRLVADSFDKKINTTHDTLVAFLAPWCAHSQALHPVLHSLADRLSHVDTIRIAAFDATKNEIDAVHVDAFPTIYFFPLHKPPIRYQNDRSLPALLAFLQAKASSALLLSGPLLDSSSS